MRRKTKTPSPIPVAKADCPECWVSAGREHELSCPEVSFEAFAELMRQQGRPVDNDR